MSTASFKLTHEELMAELSDLREAVRQDPALMKRLYSKRALEALKQTVMFRSANDEDLIDMCKNLEVVRFPAGSLIVRDNCDLCDAYVIYSGDVRRWTEEGGRKQLVVTFCPRSVGLLHFYMDSVRSRYNAECVTDVVAFRMRREDLDTAFAKHPQLARSVIRDLSYYIRQQSRQMSTPLLEQKAFRASYTVTSIAAFVESFYRSLMNSLINRAITGVKAPFFPDMHIQIPVRIIYINGLKQVRAALDTVEFGFQAGSAEHSLARVGLSLVPGIVMCPFSSLLEAANVPHSKDPLSYRWTRGFAPRLVREVLFAIGINQLSDFIAERVPTDSPYMRSALGSLGAGVTSGYLSHVPHILSVKKLADPAKSYRELWRAVYEAQLANVPADMPEPVRHSVAKVRACLFPVGVVRRSLQISGSFCIINFITYGLRNKEWY